jgi:beta-glucosidase
LKTNAQVAREAATEGMVLLKNETNSLPLTSKGKVALFGNSAYDLVAGGTGSGDVNKQYTISLDQGLAQAGFTLDESLKQSYANFITVEKAKRPKLPWFLLPPPIPEMSVAKDRLEQLANDSTLAIIVVGRNSGEFSDRKVEKDFALAPSEHAFIEEVASTFHAKGKKVIAVMNCGGPIEMASWRSFPDAILLAWQPGQEGGHAITDVLTGKVNPSGKLPNTFPVTYSDVPSASTFPGKELADHPPLTTNPFGGKPAEAVYEEGIYVGYRYYNTFGVKPAYEFGYGLSYTNFSYSPISLNAKNFRDKLTATVSIRNTGQLAGKEVVQLYLKAPKQKLKKPESELRGFVKTRLLQPGESQTVTFTITPRDLSSFDTASSSWIAEGGTYTVNVGASSLNIKNSASFRLDKDLVVVKSRKLLAPQRKIKELEPK